MSPPTSESPLISIAIPAYNEADNLPACVAEAAAAAQALFGSYEIIIVDDGSRDQTLAVAQRLAATTPHIKVLTKANGGIGSAVTMALSQATGNWFTYTPADNQFDFREMQRLLPFMEKADVIVGTKNDFRHYPWRRRFYSLMSRLLLRLLFGVKVRDANFIHLYRAAVYPRLRPTATGAFFHAETLARAVAQKLRIVEIPLPLRQRQRGVSAGASLKNVIKAVIEMLRYRFTSALTTVHKTDAR